MDTISRESNSMLPVGAIIVGVIALLLGGYAAVTVSKLNRALTEQDAKIAKIDSVESTAGMAAGSAEKSSNELKALRAETQRAFDQVGAELSRMSGVLLKLEDAAKKPASVASKDSKKGGEPVVAGPGEYVVKPGDSGMKIATAHGVSIGDLQSVNPGVNWNSLKIGQKLKLPKK